MEAHAEQDIVLVLMDKNVYDLSDGSGKCAAVVGMKDSLNERGQMNSTATNVGGWNACERRQWCNNDFRNALPATTRALFKQFKSVAANGGSAESTAVTSDDYFTLPAEKEVFGETTYANATVEADFSQLDWYGTASNRIKKMNGGAFDYYNRSAYYSAVGFNQWFCVVTSGGEPAANPAGTSLSLGISPQGVI